MVKVGAWGHQTGVHVTALTLDKFSTPSVPQLLLPHVGVIIA